MAQYERIKSIIEEETPNIRNLISEGKCLEAFNELNLLLLYCSSQLEHIKNSALTPFIMHALLEWVSNNKELIDDVVKGIGGEGYAIFTSLNGINLSVTFPSMDCANGK